MSKIQASNPVFTGFRQLPGGSFAFTMVPNQFLDEIVPFEKPCVVKVVCLVLRRTLGWIDQTGQRRQQDQVAYSEFAREMNMSTQAVADGLKIALEKGYIVRVKAGTMRDATSGNPEAAWYGLRWLSPLQTTPPIFTPSQAEPVSPVEAPLATLKSADSDKQTALSSLINRDMINKADSEKIIQVELKPSSKTLVCKKRSKFSSYIGNLVSDIGEQFGDGEHRLSNIKQALNCWNKSELAEKEFAQLLYQARNLTRQHTNALTNPAIAVKPKPVSSFGSWVTLAGTPSETETSQPDKLTSTLPRNRMPYFFKVLQDLVNRPEFATIPEELPTLPVGDLALSNFPTGNKQKVTLHNSISGADTLVEREVGIRAVVDKELVEQTVSEPVGLNKLQSISAIPTETPPELTRLAERFADNHESVLAGWQRWEASLQEYPRLKAIARRALPVERSQVKPDLQSVLFSSGSSQSQLPDIKTDFLLIFRNAFDARYARSFINEIAGSLGQAHDRAVEVYMTHL
jgi:hypothetical protein